LENLLSEGWGCEKPTILSDRRQLLRPPLNCRASGFVQSPTSHNFRDSVWAQPRAPLITPSGPHPGSRPAQPLARPTRAVSQSLWPWTPMGHVFRQAHMDLASRSRTCQTVRAVRPGRQSWLSKGLRLLLRQVKPHPAVVEASCWTTAEDTCWTTAVAVCWRS